MLFVLKKSLPYLFLFIIALFGVKALFHPGFYTNHDGEHQVLRLYYYNQALKDGQMPPRWAGTADNGYGYPLFIFSYHTPWFIGIPLLRMGFSLTDSVKGIFIIGYLLSGITMYLWLKNMLGKIPGFCGAFIYLWAPYRFSNLFVRASLGEATAFLFVPLLFWGIWEISRRKAIKGLILTAVGLAGIILSHIMALVIFVVPLVFWIFLLFFQAERKKQFLIMSALALVLGLSLSSFYFLPAFMEKNLTRANELISNDYGSHFVTLNQLIYSKWGFGFDYPGTENDGMSFQIGITQWLVVGIIFLTALLSLRGAKRRSNLLYFSFFSYAFSVFMMLPVSKPLWEIITKYSYFDFPWRFLMLSVFSASVAGAYLTSLRRDVPWYVSTITILMLISLYTNRNHLNVNKYIYNPVGFYEEKSDTTNQYNEYRPKTLDQNYIKEKRDRLGENTDLHIEQAISRSNFLEINGTAIKNTTQKINIAYYPGWKIYLNGKVQPEMKSPEGVMEVKISRGKFSLIAVFSETSLRIIADYLSMFSLIILVILFLIRQIDNHKTFIKV